MCAFENGQKVVTCGTHRIRLARETLDLVEPLFPEFGITRVANITGLDTIGIPTVLVTRPNSRSLSVTQGKGLDLNAAKASAVMEAVEHFHAERVELPVRWAPYAELSTLGPIVNPEALPSYLRPFSPHEALLWVQGSVYPTLEPIWVPYEMVHLNLTLPLPPGSGVFPLGSNGLASGNSLAEALAHGVWELVERDAVALFYAMSPSEQQQRRLRLGSVDDASACELLDRYARAKIRVGVWDVTSDVGIAAFYAAIVEEVYDPFRPIGKASGYGCHLDRGVALCRALTEAAQSRLTRISGSRDDIQREDYDRIRAEASIRRHQAELEGEGQRSFQAVPTQTFSGIEDDLRETAHRVERASVGPVLFVDLSRAGYRIFVVRAIIPGLEGAPDVPGYVPGFRAVRGSTAKARAEVSR